MYSTSLFFFYILTELDEYGYHVVGYFRWAAGLACATGACSPPQGCLSDASSDLQ